MKADNDNTRPLEAAARHDVADLLADGREARIGWERLREMPSAAADELVSLHRSGELTRAGALQAWEWAIHSD